MQTTNWSQFKSEKVKDPTVIVSRFEDKKGNRFYYRKNYQGDIIIHAGVTSVIKQVMPESPYLTEWKINHGKNWKDELNKTSTYGTMMHILFADWFNNGNEVFKQISQAEEFCQKCGVNSDMPSKDLYSFVKWNEDYKVEPLIIEGMVLSAPVDGESFCMTIDNLCYITIREKHKEMVKVGEYKIGEKKGQDKMEEKTIITERKALALVDYKSNFAGKEDSKSYFDAHKYQLIAAKEAIEFNFGAKVEIIANFSPLNWRDEPSYQFTIHNIEPKDYEIYQTYMKLAKLRGLFEPHGRILIPGDYKSSNGFKYVSYRDYITLKLNENENGSKN